MLRGAWVRDRRRHSAWSRHQPRNGNDRGVHDKCSDNGGVRRRNRADPMGGGQSAATETGRERECSMPRRQPDDASQSTQQRRLCPAPAYTLPMRTANSPRATEPTRCLLIGGPSLSAPLAITRAIPPASPVLADYPLGLVPHFAHPSSHVDPLRQVDRRAGSMTRAPIGPPFELVEDRIRNEAAPHGEDIAVAMPVLVAAE